MKSNGGEIIRNLRKNMGVSQEELADKLFISQRQLSRIETGEAELGLMDFIMAFSMLGHPTDDFWIVHLSYEDFLGYTQYQRVRKLLFCGSFEGIRRLNPPLSENSLLKRSFMAQFARYVDIVISDMPAKDKIDGLHSALKLTIKNFTGENMSQYRLTYNEALILNELALQHSKQGDTAKAISLLQGIAGGIENSRMTNDEKKLVLPKPLVDLYRLLANEGQYQQTLQVCEAALAQSRRYLNYNYGPEITYTMARCHQQLGASPDIYLPLYKRAFHTARGIEQHELAKKIREEGYHEV